MAGRGRREQEQVARVQVWPMKGEREGGALDTAGARGWVSSDGCHWLRAAWGGSNLGVNTWRCGCWGLSANYLPQKRVSWRGQWVVPLHGHIQLPELGHPPLRPAVTERPSFPLEISLPVVTTPLGELHLCVRTVSHGGQEHRTCSPLRPPHTAVCSVSAR